MFSIHRARSVASVMLLLAAGVACACVASCDAKNPSATFISPALGGPCQFYDCGQHGVCGGDVASGPSCTCDDGFVGQHCEKAVCYAGFHWDAKHECVPNQSCAAQPSNPCGAHGVCDDTDGVVGCSCETGYLGARCNLCASGYGRDSYNQCLQLVLGPASASGGAGSPGSASTGAASSGSVSSPICSTDTCNGHGQCTEASATAHCQCDSNYAGTRCASCDSGSHRDLHDGCVANEVCNSATCGAHGTCDSTTGLALCQCAAGYAGAACSSCAAGFHDPGDHSCLLDDKCLTNSCGGHGACADGTGVVQCTCGTAYAGAHCESCATGNHRAPDDSCVKNEVCAANSCSVHGACDAKSGVIVCQCDAGYTGIACTSCASGYHSDGQGGCPANPQCQPASCPAHASCDASSGVIACTCATGYQGAACDSCSTGFKLQSGSCVPSDCAHAPSCGPHGTCNDQGGSPLCVCAAGFAGAACDQCATGFSGASCATCATGYHADGHGGCAVNQQCQANSCPATASCDASSGVVQCTCATGYQGAACDSCASGFKLQGGSCVPSDCAHAPSCVASRQCSDLSGSPVCVCLTGYVGATCNQCASGYQLQGGQCVRDSTCLTNTCNTHGACSVTNSQVNCACNPGYSGLTCDACSSGYGVAGSACRTCLNGPETFDALAYFPAATNTCTGISAPLSLDGMTFKSPGTGGNVWECGPNLLYGLTSRHIALEAGATSPAEIVFDGAIASLSFDYAARLGTLDVEILGDGQVMGSVTQINNGNASLSFTFTTPIVSFQIRSKSGITSQIALDNITYKLAACTP